MLNSGASIFICKYFELSILSTKDVKGLIESFFSHKLKKLNNEYNGLSDRNKAW